MSELCVIGTPLDESTPLSALASRYLSQCQLIIGESRKLTLRYCRLGNEGGTPVSVPIYFLDNATPLALQQISQELKKLAASGGRAALMADTGMPILFDPGIEIIAQARQLNFRIRTIPAATSWATAAALSGYAPPFYIADFLPREKPQRLKSLEGLLRLRAHCVIMDTPYRFRALIDELRQVFGDHREVFLAWAIARPTENYFWGNLPSLLKVAEKQGLVKGEFVFILKAI